MERGSGKFECVSRIGITITLSTLWMCFYKLSSETTLKNSVFSNKVPLQIVCFLVSENFSGNTVLWTRKSWKMVVDLDAVMCP